MRGITRVFLATAFLQCCATALAQELVHFPSLEDNGPGRPSTTLDGYLFLPAGSGKHPALVFLHGCDGMFNRSTGLIGRRERDWAAELTPRGYIVLTVDSFGPRNHGEMCSQQSFDRELYLRRPRDAYGALLFLQAQPYVRADRVGVIGWSQGGGAVLYAIRAQSIGRPVQLPQGNFQAAVAFYPGLLRRAAATGLDEPNPASRADRRRGRLDPSCAVQDVSRRRNRTRRPD